MDFTIEEYEEWKASRVTQEIRSKIKEELVELTSDLGNGSTLSEEGSLTIQNTALQVGKVQGLNYFLSEEYLDD